MFSICFSFVLLKTLYHDVLASDQIAYDFDALSNADQAEVLNWMLHLK
jgi:hypothetical protein